MHVGRGTAARKIGDWKSAVREADAAIAAGADSAPLVTTFSWFTFSLLIVNVSVSFIFCVLAFILTLCLQLLALRSEALLRLHKLEEADSTLSSLVKLESVLSSLMAEKLIGMLTESYVYIVRAQVDMALGRYDLPSYNT